MRGQAQNYDATRILLREADAGLPHAADVFEGTSLKLLKSLIGFFEEGQRNSVDAVARRRFDHTIRDPQTRLRRGCHA